jgi:DDE_Tnp_1-associated
VLPEALSARVQAHFGELTDPRHSEETYPLLNMVMIAVCAVIRGADDFVSSAHSGRLKSNSFGRFLNLGAGITSHDRFNAILGAIKPAEFESCLC